jgi:hypothetical protein
MLRLDDYECNACGCRFESLESRDALPSCVPCESCGADAARQFCAPKIQACRVAVLSNANVKTPPPWATSPMLLAEGMPVKEWRGVVKKNLMKNPKWVAKRDRVLEQGKAMFKKALGTTR